MWCAHRLPPGPALHCSPDVPDWVAQVARYGAAFTSRIFDLQLKDSVVHRVLVSPDPPAGDMLV